MRSTRSHNATELLNSGQTQMALPLLRANRNNARLNLPELLLKLLRDRVHRLRGDESLLGTSNHGLEGRGFRAIRKAFTEKHQKEKEV